MPRRPVLMLTAALIPLAGVPTFAQPVNFNNSGGTFHWSTYKTFWTSGIPQQIAYLDITQPASQATASAGPRFDSRVHWPNPNTSGGGFLFEATNASIATNGTFTTNNGVLPLLSLAKVLHPGDTVGSSLSFNSEAYTKWLDDPSSTSQPDTDFFPSTAYIGVTLTLDDGLHYGWIEIQPETPNDLSHINVSTEYYAPLAWGYESTPNTAITIPVPEPASLMLLALAAPALLRRRR